MLPGKAGVQLGEGTADVDGDDLVHAGLEGCQGGLWRENISFLKNISFEGW